MSELTSLTLKQALDGLAAKTFSSAEITQAHVKAVEAARALNAFVVETPEKALEMARASDAEMSTARTPNCKPVMRAHRWRPPTVSRSSLPN